MKAKNRNKKRIKQYKIQRKITQGIRMKCKKCGLKMTIETTRPEIYTKEVKRNWICINCYIKEVEIK